METPPATPLLTTTDIADRIAATRGQCNAVTVWRAIRRLKIEPAQTAGRQQIKLYTEADAVRIGDELRAPNKKAEPSVA